MSQPAIARARTRVRPCLDEQIAAAQRRLGRLVRARAQVQGGDAVLRTHLPGGVACARLGTGPTTQLPCSDKE